MKSSLKNQKAFSYNELMWAINEKDSHGMTNTSEILCLVVEYFTFLKDPETVLSVIEVIHF